MTEFTNNDDNFQIPCRVLSIQSHVISGCVGNKAAIFPLQLLGFDVDFINSVQFSNHNGYPYVKGTAVSGNELKEMVNGLHLNGLLNYDYLLTGYIGSETFLDSILEVLDSIKSVNPLFRYICDPVLGDNGKYYVPKPLVNLFAEKVISRAYMITPNQFEAELLTGHSIKCHEDVIKVLLQLHKMGPDVILLTSSILTEFPNKLCCYVLAPIEGTLDKDNNDNINNVIITRVIIDSQEGYFTGTGDATAALMLAWSHLLGDNKHGEALVKTMTTIQAIISKTKKHQSLMKKHTNTYNRSYNNNSNSNIEILIEDKKIKSIDSRFAELCIVQSKLEIENPPSIPLSSLIESWIIDSNSNLISI
jgi:pyridoxine kinase